jgi:hypothetical protein
MLLHTEVHNDMIILFTKCHYNIHVHVSIIYLPVQSVPITTKVVSSNPAHGEVYSLQHFAMKFANDVTTMLITTYC